VSHADYVCKCCEKPCEVISVDFGIGAYEYWGATGVDVNIQEVSLCCEDDYWTGKEYEDYLAEKAEEETDE
jgi:hypothetical protein